MSKNKRIVGFDYIKIVASSLLVLHHYQQVFNCRFSYVNFYGGYITFGYLVELFFMISGYLTVYSDSYSHSRSSITTGREGGGARIIHKILRIYPMSFVSIVICLLLKTVLGIASFDNTIIELYSPKNLIINFLLLFSGCPPFERMGINNPIWYVCILIQCYIVYYFLQFFNMHNKEKRIRLILQFLLIFSLFIMHKIDILNSASFRGLCSFFLGIFVYTLNKTIYEYKIFKESNKAKVAICSIIVSISFFVLIMLGLNQHYVLMFFVYPLFIFGMSNLSLKDYGIVSLLSNISFDLYVFHYPLMVAFELFTYVVGIDVQHTYTTMTAFLVIAWLMAYLFWKYLDMPIRRLISSFEKNNV